MTITFKHELESDLLNPSTGVYTYASKVLYFFKKIIIYLNFVSCYVTLKMGEKMNTIYLSLHACNFNRGV